MKQADKTQPENINGWVIQHYFELDCSINGLFLKEDVLLFVRKGGLTVNYGNVRYYLQQDQSIFLKRGIVINLTQFASDEQFYEIEYFLITLTVPLLKEFVTIADLQSLKTDAEEPVAMLTTNERLKKFFDSFDLSLIDPKNNSYRLVRIKLLELLFIVSETNGSVIRQVLNFRSPSRMDITEIVEENITNSVSVESLARLSRRSLSSFRRDFLSIYNMPPSQWIREHRLTKSFELLAHTKMSVTDVCYSLGFENLTHFSRIFKSHFGHAPSMVKSGLHHSVKLETQNDSNSKTN